MVHQGTLEQGSQIVGHIQRGQQLTDRLARMASRQRGYSGQALQVVSQASKIAGRGQSGGSPIDQPFEISKQIECLAYFCPPQAIGVKSTDLVQAPRDVGKVEQGRADPLLEQPPAHRRDGGLQHAQQRATHRSGAQGFRQFQIAAAWRCPAP